jgi:uncharacterized protein (UPF0332 family)
VTDENRRENALNEAALGDDASKAARALVDLGLPNDAVSRAYYAAFHYGRAVLLCHGLEPKTHRGVLALLERSAGEAGWLSRDAVTRLGISRPSGAWPTTMLGCGSRWNGLAKR